jgi:hypothetical protein
MFGSGVSMAYRLSNYRNILQFLGFSSEPSHWDKALVEAVLHPSAKLNDSSTLGLIPNIKEIQNRFEYNFKCGGR